MGRIDCRTPARRRAERVMWVMLYALTIGCGALLGYLGFGAPEQSLAGGGRDTRPAEHHAPTPSATPRADRADRTAPAPSPAPVPAKRDAAPAPAPEPHRTADTDRTPHAGRTPDADRTPDTKRAPEPNRTPEADHRRESDQLADKPADFFGIPVD